MGQGRVFIHDPGTNTHLTDAPMRDQPLQGVACKASPNGIPFPPTSHPRTGAERWRGSNQKLEGDGHEVLP